MKRVESTIDKLCAWIERAAESRNPEELAVLPEVVKSTAELIKATR